MNHQSLNGKADEHGQYSQGQTDPRIHNFHEVIQASPISHTIISTPSDLSGSPSNGGSVGTNTSYSDSSQQAAKTHQIQIQIQNQNQNQNHQFLPPPPPHQSQNPIQVQYGSQLQNLHIPYPNSQFRPMYNQYPSRFQQPPIPAIPSDPNPMAPPIDTPQLQGDSKRRKALPVPRRRALTACEKCRIKKVKCDNVRPVCGACERTSAKCLFVDNQDTPAFDQNNASILNKLDVVLKELGHLKEEKALKERDPNPSFYWSSCNWIASTESVLRWPIFHQNSIITDKMPKFQFNKSIIQVLSQNNEKNLPLSNSLIMDYTITKEDITENLAQYISSYLDNVHSKSPFIDVNKLLLTVKYIENNNNELIHNNENLIPASIMIICCALGMMATPITLSNLVDFQSSLIEKNHNGKFEKSYKMLKFSQFLKLSNNSLVPDNSVAQVQFSLLLGIYYMYILKPLKSYKYINRASLALITHLESTDETVNYNEETKRLQERLYWTCVKYESEIRVELSPYVPPSTITNYPPPASFPIPPLNLNDNQHETEHTWYFFLTEIALRKLENEILDELYTDLSIWAQFSEADITNLILKNLNSLNNVIQSLNPQIKQIILSDESAMSSEPIMFIKTRIVAIKIILYRPMAYYLFHNPGSSASIERNEVFKQAFTDCIALSQLLHAELGAHRHNGSWYYLRNTFLGTILVYHFIKYGMIGDNEVGIKKLLEGCVRLYTYWKDEANDLERTIEILKIMLSDVS